MNSMKRQKDMTRPGEMSPAGRRMSNILLGKSGGLLLTAPERMKQLGQSRSDAQLWMCPVVKAKSDAGKTILRMTLECEVRESR